MADTAPPAGMQFNDETGVLEADPLAAERTVVETAPPFTEQAALEQTKKLIRFRDFAQSRLLAWGAGDISQHETFGLETWEFDMLVEAYSGIVQKMGKLPAWFDILLAESVVMGPKFVKLIKLRKLEAENQMLRSQNSQLLNRQAQHQAVSQAQAAGQRVRRKEGKKRWEVDSNGFFTHDRSGRTYLKIKDRLERPDPVHDWDRLSKWNSADLLKNAFNR